LCDPSIFRTEQWERDGELHPVLFYQVSAEDLVWGATARILSQFLALLDEEGGGGSRSCPFASPAASHFPFAGGSPRVDRRPRALCGLRPRPPHRVGTR